jgi:formamidopyrimidine-DNA glycosylase
MPELPEVETTKRGIQRHIENQTVSSVIIRQKNLRWPIPTCFEHDIINSKIKNVTRRGKYILLHTTNGCAVMHLGMSGSLRILPANTPALKHDHVDIIFNSKICLRFNDPRRFGCVLWTKTNPLQHKLLTNLGPEPLTDEFNADYIVAKARQKNITVKQFIMNSQVVVGVGNIYACEALFTAGILPTKPAGKISKVHYEKLVSEIKRILHHAIEIGGTTLRDFVNSDGKPGYFKQQLKVYGRAGLACTVCQKNLIEIRLNNRSTVFCKTCQR